jgi:hypothetical protein
MTKPVHFTQYLRPDGDGDYAYQIVPNGPQVPQAVERLIMTWSCPQTHP